VPIGGNLGVIGLIFFINSLSGVFRLAVSPRRTIGMAIAIDEKGTGLSCHTVGSMILRSHCREEGEAT
jgi:hypothetical protein